MEPKIIFEDGEILVLEKPAGMVVNRAESVKRETVQEWVEKRLPATGPAARHLVGARSANKRLRASKVSGSRHPSPVDFLSRSGIVHRLDKETSGLLLVAKTPEAFTDLQKQFAQREVEKKYLALVHGEVKPAEGIIRAPVGRLPWHRERFGVLPGGREAVTKYKVIKHYPLTPKPYTLLELSPLTGRTHQIRVHLKYLGHPVVSDSTYAGRKVSRIDKTWCPRMFLHATYLKFKHPKTGKWREFTSPLPPDLENLCRK